MNHMQNNEGYVISLVIFSIFFTGTLALAAALFLWSICILVFAYEASFSSIFMAAYVLISIPAIVGFNQGWKEMNRPNDV